MHWFRGSNTLLFLSPLPFHRLPPFEFVFSPSSQSSSPHLTDVDFVPRIFNQPFYVTPFLLRFPLLCFDPSPPDSSIPSGLFPFLLHLNMLHDVEFAPLVPFGVIS